MCDSDEVCNSDSESCVSDTSTLEYDQEAFESFKHKVFKLCSTIFRRYERSITIERMKGGGFNRIIGVSIDEGDNALPSQYVCRIPRLDDTTMARDLAPLRLLRQSSTIPVPEVISYNTTITNLIGSPYMMQKHLAGEPLYPNYPSLPQQVKCLVAKELGEAFFQMHQIESTTAGVPHLENGSLLIEPFNDSMEGNKVVYQEGRGIRTISETLITALEGKKIVAIRDVPDYRFHVLLFDSLVKVVREMTDLGLLQDSRYCLCHLDLEPRNILAKVPGQSESQAFTGILDWDSAVFAPLMMSCSPPMWL